MPPCPATNSTVIPIGSFGSTIRGRDALPLARDRRHAARPFPSLQASAILTSADCAVEEVAGASDDHSSRSEEHTSELQSLMRISHAVYGLKKKTNTIIASTDTHINYTDKDESTKQ